jgi:YVTN family beta-propeller protein
MIFRLLAVGSVAIIAGVVPASSRAATLAPTPTMGWNPYYGLGGKFSEAVIKSVANSLISTGLAQAGYKLVSLDFGWASGARDSGGNLLVGSSQWPDGMSGLASWLHGQGLEAGIYTDAGRTGCNNKGLGSYGHYQQDANTFAGWGFDAVKVDFCGAGQEGLGPPTQLYTQFADAVANNSSGRPMLLNVDNFWVPGQINGTDPSPANSSWDNYQWAPQVAQSWRTDTDIGFPHDVQFQWVLRNLDQDAAHPEVAGPGHWNDPDYLAPGLGMTDTEARSQFSMWAILAAPLILSSDPRALSPAEISMLENPNVIAVDQDSLGAQGTLVQQAGAAQVWAKPLANGDSAVALFNRGTTAVPISTTAGAVGLPQASGYTLEDLWTGQTTPTDPQGDISAVVPPHGVTLYQVSTSGPVATPPPGDATLTVTRAGVDGVVAAGSGGLSCPGACSANYPSGTTVTLTATPTAGATFAGWRGGGCSGTATCQVTVSSDTTVVAAFVPPLHRLTVSATGNGTIADATGAISCPAYCSAPFAAGSQVTLNATPGPGYMFAGWSGGGCSGLGACTVSLTADTSVSATFLPTHTLTVSVIGAGRGTITAPGISCPGTCSASYPAGTSVVLTATPATRSQFGAWLSGGCPAAATTCAVRVAANKDVSAAFDRPRSGAAYVVDGRRNEVIPIDLATDTAEPAIHGFDAPGQLVISPDGGTAYVVNAGTDTVVPIDLATNTVEPAIRGFGPPGPIAISPDGRTAYVFEDDRRLVPIDLQVDVAEPAITFRPGSGVGEHAESLAISRNGRNAILGSFNARRRVVSGTVAVVDLRSGRVKAVVHGFVHPSAIAIAPNGRTAYVADPTRGTVTPINLRTDRALAAPELTAEGAFPDADAAAITPNGKTVYIADNRTGVATINTATRSPKPAGLTLREPRDLAITPNGATAYFTSGDGSVIPIDLATGTERPALIGLGSPAAIAITDPPPPNDSVKLSGRLKRSAGAIADGVKCLAPTRGCLALETLSVTVHGKGPALVVGQGSFRIRAGRTVHVTIRLNDAGRQLLSSVGRLPVILSVAIRRGSHVDTVATRQVTIEP